MNADKTGTTLHAVSNDAEMENAAGAASESTPEKQIARAHEIQESLRETDDSNSAISARAVHRLISLRDRAAKARQKQHKLSQEKKEKNLERYGIAEGPGWKSLLWYVPIFLFLATVESRLNYEAFLDFRDGARGLALILTLFVAGVVAGCSHYQGVISGFWEEMVRVRGKDGRQTKQGFIASIVGVAIMILFVVGIRWNWLAVEKGSSDVWGELGLLAFLNFSVWAVSWGVSAYYHTRGENPIAVKHLRKLEKAEKKADHCTRKFKKRCVRMLEDVPQSSAGKTDKDQQRDELLRKNLRDFGELGTWIMGSGNNKKIWDPQKGYVDEHGRAS